MVTDDSSSLSYRKTPSTGGCSSQSAAATGSNAPRSPGEPGHVPRGPTRGLRARDGPDQQVKKV